MIDDNILLQYVLCITYFAYVRENVASTKIASIKMCFIV